MPTGGDVVDRPLGSLGTVASCWRRRRIQFKGTGWYVTTTKKSSGDAQDGARKDGGEGKAAGDAKGDSKKSAKGKDAAAAAR